MYDAYYSVQRLKPPLVGVPPSVHLRGRNTPPAQADGQPQAHQARLESLAKTI